MNPIDLIYEVAMGVCDFARVIFVGIVLFVLGCLLGGIAGFYAAKGGGR